MIPSRTPQVSIVIPCFNSQDFLEETLASVYAQTYTDWELILINDGSTDETGAILEEHLRQSDGRISVRSTPNRGMNLSRNLGLSLAKGRFVQVLDSDDLLMPGSLAARVEVLEFSNADVAYGDFQLLVPDRKRGYREGEVVTSCLENFDPDIETAVVQNFWMPPACLLYRKDLVDRLGGFDNKYPVVADHMLMLEAARAGARWVRAAGIMALYRKNSASSTQRNKSALYTEIFHSARDVDETWTKIQNPLPESRRKALAKRYFLAANYFYEHDRGMFEAIWSRIKRHDPRFIPPSTHAMKLFSALFGYPNAEALALFWRKIKRSAGSAS